MGVHGNSGSWPIIRRMQEGKPVIVHGDGSSLWTFTFNTDFAKGFCGLMGNVHAIGEAVHITSDEKMCIRDSRRPSRRRRLTQRKPPSRSIVHSL